MGGAEAWALPMQQLWGSGRADAAPHRKNQSCHYHLSQALSTRLLPTITCSATPRPSVSVASIHALDPDFYKIPYADGLPVGKRLKLWNLPPNCKHSELLEWFAGADVVVESLELTDDPALIAQGVGGFVEFATKQHACIAVVRLDGYKFRGHYIRMDFAERRPRPNYGSKRHRPHPNSSRRGSFSKFSARTAEERAPNTAGASSSGQQIPRCDVTVTRPVEPSSAMSLDTTLSIE